MKLNPRIGGPNALSWPAFWVLLAASVAINLPDRYTSWTLASSWRNLLCNVVAVAAMFGVMLVLRSVLLRDAAVHPHPWRAVGIFTVGAATRGLMLAALLPVIGDGTAVPLYRVITSVLILVPLLAITAGVVDLVRTSAARRAALQAEAGDLLAAERDALMRTTELQQGAIAQVRALLLQRLEAMRAAGAHPADLESDLRHDVEQVIRPMSHELFTGDAEPAPVASAPPAPRVQWGDVWRSASLGAPFRPIALATLIAVAFVNAFVNYNASVPRGLAFAAAQWVIVYVTFTVLERFLTHPMRRMRVGLRTATLVVASIGGLVVAGLVVAVMIQAAGGAGAARVPLAMMLLGPIVVLALAAEQGFRRQVAAVEAEQAGITAAQRVAAALAASARRHEERRLSRALHGPVQTAVTAAAMRIEAGDDAGAEAMLVDAIGHLDLDAREMTPVADALGEVTLLWDGLCMVTTDLDPGLDSELDARPTAASAFIDICVEACSNAVRHGGARHVMLGARRGRGTLQVEIRDDGAPAGPDTAAGLGTALLDEVTLDWDRHREGDLTVMRATLPLGN